MAESRPEVMRMGPAARDGRKRPENQSVPELVRSIAADTSTLVRKEIELARRELVEGMMGFVKAIAAVAIAGALSLFVLGFLGSAAAAALDQVMRPWGSRLVVAGGFLLLAAMAGLFGLRAMKRASIKTERTRRTVKEDVEWAKAQLKR